MKLNHMVEILKLSLVNIFNSKFTRVADVWLRCLVEIEDEI